MSVAPSNPDVEAASRIAAITTRWSLLEDAHGGDANAQTVARQTMVVRYEKAIRAYCRALAGNDADADDLAQDVVMRLLSGDFSGADPSRGRFRDFLKTAIRNMIRNTWRRQKTRRTVDFDPDLVGSGNDPLPDQWDTCWRDELIASTLAAVRQAERRNPDTLAHTVLQLRYESPGASSAELAAQVSERTGKSIRPDAFRQKLRRARLLFTDLLLQEIARGLETPTPDQIEGELVSLGILSIARPYLPEDWCAASQPDESV